MNTDTPQFITIKRFVDAVDEFHVQLRRIANGGNQYTDCIGHLLEYAPPVIEGARAFEGIVAFSVSAEERADLAMLRMREDFARRAERENDLMLAADERDAAARLAVHVARRIVEARMGKPGVKEADTFEPILRASIKQVAEKKAQSFPSDHGLNGGGNVVPMNGAKAGA